MENNKTNPYEADWEKEIENKSFEELAKIVANKQDYNPKFAEIAEIKLKSRNDYNEHKVNNIIESERKKQQTKEEENEQRMSGWLVLFMIGIAVGSIAFCFRSFKAFNPELYGYKLPLMWSDIATVIGVVIVGVYTFISLYKRWTNAIHLTYFYIGICIFLNLILLLSVEFDSFSLLPIFWGIIVSVLWLLYFRNSKRIEARYPIEDREWHKRDKWILGTVIVVPLLLFIWGLFVNPSIPRSSVAEGMDVTEVDQSTYLIDENKLKENEITDGIVIIKVPEGVEYEQLTHDDGAKCYDLTNNKTNPAYAIRVVSQGYVEPGDIVFENLWEQYQDSTMMDIPHEIVRSDVSEMKDGKCYRKVVKYKSDVDMFWDFTLLYDWDQKKACLLNSYYRDDVKAPIDELINGIKFSQE